MSCCSLYIQIYWRNRRMKPSIKKFICGVSAAALMALSSVTAFADHTYQLDNSDGLCYEIISDKRDINGTEGEFETEFGDSTEEKYFSLRFKLFNEYLDAETWNSDDLTVSVEVKLETEGANVIGCMPAFNSKWDWINPSDYTPLVYNEWVTVSEKGSHFYNDFASAAPGDILFQVRTNWGEPAQGNVKLSVRNFRISDNGAADATTAPEDTSAPDAETTPTAEPSTTLDTEGSAENQPATAEQAGTAEISEPEQTTTPAETTAATTIRTAATVATSSAINYSELYAAPESPVTMIIIIVAVAAVIVIGAVVGYIIYRKKKFY